MPLDHLPPSRAVRGSGCVHAAELVKVAHEDQGGATIGVVPEPHQLLEGLPRQLPDFVDDDQVEGRHGLVGLLFAQVKQEHAVQRVDVQVRELFPIAACEDAGGAGNANVGSPFCGSLDGDLHSRALSAACRAQRAERPHLPGRLVDWALQQRFELLWGHVLRVAALERPYRHVVDCVHHGGLLRVQLAFGAAPGRDGRLWVVFQGPLAV